MNTAEKQKPGRKKSENPRVGRLTTVTRLEQKAKFVEAAEGLGISEALLLRQATNHGLKKMGLEIAI